MYDRLWALWRDSPLLGKSIIHANNNGSNDFNKNSHIRVFCIHLPVVFNLGPEGAPGRQDGAIMSN